MSSDSQHVPLARERANVNEALAIYEQGWFEQLASKDLEIATLQTNIQRLVDENKWLRDSEITPLSTENDRLIRENNRLLSDNDCLSTENAELRRQTDARQSALSTESHTERTSTISPPGDQARSPTRPEPATTISNAHDSGRRTNQEMQSLRNKVESQRKSIDIVTGKYHRLKKTTERWREYADRLEARLAFSKSILDGDNAEANLPIKKVVPPTQLLDDITRGLGFPILLEDDETRTDRSSSVPVHPAPAATAHEFLLMDRTEGSEGMDQRTASSAIVNTSPDTRSAHANSSGDETVVSEADQQPVQIKLEKDAPVARAIILGSQGACMVEPIHLKSEPDSSPIILAQAANSVPRTLTMDLDEIGSRTKTPRKKRKYAALATGDSQDGDEHQSLHEERSFSAPLESQLLTYARLGSFDSRQNMLSRPFASDPAVKAEIEDVDRTLVDDDEDLFAEERIVGYTPSRPLRPIDKNERSLLEAHPTSKAQKSSSGSRQDRRLGQLLEDGTGGSDENRPPASKRIKAGSRLMDLLDRPDPQIPHQAVITPRSPPSRTRKSVQDSEFPRMRALLARRTPNSSERASASCTSTENNDASQTKPATGAVAKSFPVPSGAVSTPANPRAGPKGPKSFSTSSRPRGPPLRSRPLSSLNLGDFKLNPRALPKEDPETVKQAREHLKHLPNCTDPNCSHGCGAALRALAMDLNPVVPRPLFSSQDSDPTANIDITDSQANERRLLKWHLGRAYDDAVAGLSADQRGTLVLDAKVKLLAERHGKHRIRVDKRQRTPPGFWETEMPSTLEAEKSRKEKEVMDRVEVRERWREAMREGGLWIFRDE